MTRTDLFDYKLPEELIAVTPAEKRDESRLLALQRSSGKTAHLRFSDLPELLREGDLLVVNDARVVPVRLYARRGSGGMVEVLLVRRAGKCGDPAPWPAFEQEDGAEVERLWLAMVRSSGSLREGETLSLEDVPAEFRVVERRGSGFWTLSLEGEEQSLEQILRAGSMPIPPYITRQRKLRGMPAEIEPLDTERYQTVFARTPGAVAAPTAGLHFTEGLLERLRKRGVLLHPLTLLVGPGTFRPVRSERVEEHSLEPEFYHLPAATAAAVAHALLEGRRVVATGTTCCRVLEYVARHRTWEEHSGWTDMFIYPPFQFRVVSALVTNFHLPRSSLLMLVSAFAGRETVLSAYQEAVRQSYRFYSYGDAMFIY